MTYTWNDTFSLEDALSGVLVGFPKTNDWDLSETGLLEFVGSRYQVYINGYKLYVENTGKVVECKPANSNYLNHTLQMVTADMGDEGAVGGAITRTWTEETGYSQEVTLTTIEPRDQFAVQVLNAMLIHTEHPEAFDDAKCLMYSRAAYRWAQAMMIAAADSRHGESENVNPGGVAVNSNDLQSNTEKLLYNIGEYMKNGMAVKGSVESGASPVRTEVSGLESITDSYDIPLIVDSQDNPITINIQATVFKQKYIRFEVLTYMAYSDISVYLTLTTNDGARNVGHIIPKGSVVVLMPLDDAVTDITDINSKSIRGKGGNDPNTYTFA